MKTIHASTAALLLSGLAPAAAAFEPLQGTFIAARPCAALQSLKRGTNPGDIHLETGHSYRAAGLNEADGRYVQVRVDSAHPVLRWVDRSCGNLNNDLPPPAGNPVPPKRERGDTRRYLLAISWQSAFCETKPDKPECRSLNPARFDADHFSLHGLWPQPESNAFCNVSARDKENAGEHRWANLPEPNLSAGTREALLKVMPGIQSGLQRHEYAKHGTCFPGDADRYFRTAMHLLEQINGSALRDLMTENVGKSVTTAALDQAFAHDFGEDAPRALGIHCVGDIDSRRTLISELRIQLRGTLSEASELKDVLDFDQPARRDCREGIVDPLGQQ